MSEQPEEVKKVDKTGIYTLADGTPVRLKEGALLPEGAEFRDEGTDPIKKQEESDSSKRSKGAAPENR